MEQHSENAILSSNIYSDANVVTSLLSDQFTYGVAVSDKSVKSTEALGTLDTSSMFQTSVFGIVADKTNSNLLREENTPTSSPPSWWENQTLPIENVVVAQPPVDDESSDDVQEIVWTENQRRIAHRIWVDTQLWEKRTDISSILQDLDDLSNNLPCFYQTTYSTYDRPRRQNNKRRFNVSNCWMFFADVDHAVWIDRFGYPDLSKRSDELPKEDVKRVLIPSNELHLCNVEQLKEQQELLSEIKRYVEGGCDKEYCQNKNTEQEDEGESETTDEDTNGVDDSDTEQQENFETESDANDDDDETMLTDDASDDENENNDDSTASDDLF